MGPLEIAAQHEPRNLNAMEGEEIAASRRTGHTSALAYANNSSTPPIPDRPVHYGIDVANSETETEMQNIGFDRSPDAQFHDDMKLSIIELHLQIRHIELSSENRIDLLLREELKIKSFLYELSLDKLEKEENKFRLELLASDTDAI